MIIANVAVAVVVSVIITAWASLIIESLITTGPFEPYFETLLRFDGVPENDDLITLIDDFVFVDSTGKRHVARRGMESDGASVRNLMWIPIIGWLTRIALKGGPLEGPFRPAAVSHDGIYAGATESSLLRALVSLGRAEGDRVIYEAARCKRYILTNGKRIERRPAAWWRAFLVMALLRVAGFAAWMSDSSKAQRSLAKNGQQK